jgi:hypothetical protein
VTNTTSFSNCRNSGRSFCARQDMTGEPANDAQPKRDFPPLYKSSGNVSSDRLAFFHILERLKVSASICITEAVRHFYCRLKSGLDGSIIKCIVSFERCWSSLTRLARTIDTQPREVRFFVTFISDSCFFMRRSISDHMYRMAVLAMCVSDQTLDISKYCSKRIFLCHDRP